MSALPSVHEKDNFTDWVIATARTTEVDAYLLWRLSEQQTETELMEWVDDVTAYSEITREELVLGVNRIDQNAAMPDVTPAPIPVERAVETTADESADTDEDTAAAEADTDSGAGVEAPDVEEGPGFADLMSEPDSQADTPTTTDAPEFGEPQGSTQQDTLRDDTVVTEREYQQFQEQVQEVVQNLINFLISYDMLSGDADGTRPDIERELEQAAEQADSAPEFFRQIERILAQLEGEHNIDFTEFRESVEQRDTESTEESVQLVDELKSSIDELRQLQSEIETTSRERDTESDEQASRAVTSSRMTGLSRNDDPRVLGRLNKLSQTIQDRIDETITTDEPEPDRSPSESTPEQGNDTQTEQDGGVKMETDDTDEPSASSGGVMSGSAVGFATESSEESNETGYDPRAALFPVDIGWGLASLVYGGFDMFSTVLVLGNGGSELNPIYNLLGQSIAAFVIWKTLVLFVLFILFYPDDPGSPSTTEWLIPIGTAIVGAILTINNLAVLTGGGGFI
jgi:hypothetical protein